MKLIRTQACFAAAIAASLLAGCSSHNDSAVKSNNAAVTPADQSASVPYNPQNVDRSKIPPQFQEQFMDPSKGAAQSGVTQRPNQ